MGRAASRELLCWPLPPPPDGWRLANPERSRRRPVRLLRISLKETGLLFTARPLGVNSSRQQVASSDLIQLSCWQSPLLLPAEEAPWQAGRAEVRAL